MTKGPVQEEHPGRLDSNCQFAYQGERNGCYATGFNFTRKQSHGPRADGSGGYQKSQINVRLTDASRDFLDCRHEPLGTAHQAESVVILGQAADDMLRLKLAQRSIGNPRLMSRSASVRS